MIKEIIEKIKSKKGIFLLIIGVIIGFLLIFYDSNSNQTKKTDISNSESIEQYTSVLEEKLEKILNEISGVENTKVMLTLESGSEYIYASDDTNTNEKHIIVDNELVLVKEYLPKIKGVAIICKGGNDPIIKSKITDLACSVLGIYSTRVFVSE